MLNGILHRIHPRAVVAAAGLLALAAVAYAFVTTAQRPAAAYVRATQGPITEEVDAPGTVTAAAAVDLAFQVGGRIVNQGPLVGTRVSAGTVLASLSGADAQAALEQAQAALAVQLANLDAVQSGTRAEDVAIATTAVDGAQATLAQTRTSLVASARDAYVKADDAIRNRVDQFMTNPRTATPGLNFTLSDAQQQRSIETSRVQMEGLLTQWQAYMDSLPSDSTLESDALAAQVGTDLRRVGAYLDLVSTGLTEVIYTNAYPAATVSGYQSSVQTGRTNLTSALSALDSAKTAETNAAAALASAQSQLRLKQAGATPQQLAAQQAQVAVARANLDAARAALAKTVITAPLSGTVTVNRARVGETASPSAPVLSMISDGAFQFETYVSQADLAKLAVGNTAQIALDAYQGGTPLTANVIAIDPAATAQGGSSSYKVTLQFAGKDPRLSAGLTGNARIVAQDLPQVLSIPTSAIITQDDRRFVLRRSASGDERVQVEIGVSNARGMTQVISGIGAGDEVRTFGSN